MSNVTEAEPVDYHSELAADENVAKFADRKLAVFTRNCRLLAERVAVGQLRLIDAADMLQSAAELSGLSEVVGDDVVQRIMADAFTACAGNHFFVKKAEANVRDKR